GARVMRTDAVPSGGDGAGAGDNRNDAAMRKALMAVGDQLTTDQLRPVVGAALSDPGGGADDVGDPGGGPTQGATRAGAEGSGDSLLAWERYVNGRGPKPEHRQNRDRVGGDVGEETARTLARAEAVRGFIHGATDPGAPNPNVERTDAEFERRLSEVEAG